MHDILRRVLLHGRLGSLTGALLSILAADRLCDDCICRHQVLLPGVLLLPHSSWYLHIEWGAQDSLSVSILIYICPLGLRSQEDRIIQACSLLASLSLYSLVLGHHGLLQSLQGSACYLVPITGRHCHHAMSYYPHHLHKPGWSQVCYLHSYRLCWAFGSNAGQHRHSHSLRASL